MLNIETDITIKLDYNSEYKKKKLLVSTYLVRFSRKPARDRKTWTVY